MSLIDLKLHEAADQLLLVHALRRCNELHWVVLRGPAHADALLEGELPGVQQAPTEEEVVQGGDEGPAAADLSLCPARESLRQCDG